MEEEENLVDLVEEVEVLEEAEDLEKVEVVNIKELVDAGINMVRWETVGTERVKVEVEEKEEVKEY